MTRPHACDLAGEAVANWLGEEPTTPAELKAMLVPFDDDGLKLWPINRQKIGYVRNKEAEVALPEG